MKSVEVDLSGLRVRLFNLVQLYIESRYGWSSFSASVYLV